MGSCLRKEKATTDPIEKSLSWSQRSGVLVFALLQNSLMGGIIYGWSSIDSTLLIASQTDGGAGIDTEMTSHVFSWAASVAMVSSFFLGIILDVFGPRVCSFLSCSTITIGCAILAVSNNFMHFSIGCCVMAFGGPGICSSIIHIANLFPDSKNLVMSCLSGSIAVSFSVLSIFDLLWHQYQWATFHSLFRCYTIITAFLTLGAIVIYPDDKYKEILDNDDDELSLQANDSEEKVQDPSEETTLLVKPQPAQPSSSPTTVILKHVASLSSIPEHRHHHESHIQSVAAGPSLTIQQPLHSFLRLDARTESFMVSKEVMSMDIPEKELIISLKDQPFLKQLFSGSYLRSSILFWLCSFFTNFYVSSLSTELADMDQYNTSVQHRLTRTFTLFMSAGVIPSIVVGMLIDSYGVEICTSILLMCGQLQMIIVLFFDQHESMMVASFFFYTMFRSFLYPVFIASLTSRLGFKYFGILLGIGYAISGLLQLLMAPLNDLVAGDCHSKVFSHANPVGGTDDCFEGLWTSLHLLQLSAISGLMIIPYLDYRVKVAHQTAIRHFKARSQYYNYSSVLPPPSVGLLLDDYE